MPSDLLQLVVALVAGTVGLLLASILDNISVGISVEVIDVFDGMPDPVVVMVILAVQLVVWILSAVGLGLLLSWRRYRRLSLVVLERQLQSRSPGVSRAGSPRRSRHRIWKSIHRRGFATIWRGRRWKESKPTIRMRSAISSSNPARQSVALARLVVSRWTPRPMKSSSVHLDLDYPNAKQDLSRGLPLVKWLLAIPHLVLLVFLGTGVVLSAIVAWFSVPFTGRYPRAIFDYIEGVMRWSLRVGAYAVLLITDEYPPFRLA